MTGADRIWTWPGGHYRTTTHRPLDDREGPGGVEYVRADMYEALLEINASQAADIARMMKVRP